MLTRRTRLGDRTLPDHCSMSVSALAAPVFTFAESGPDWELLECRLLTGYILYLTIPANRLEPSGQRSYRIWRSTPLIQI